MRRFINKEVFPQNMADLQNIAQRTLDVLVEQEGTVTMALLIFSTLIATGVGAYQTLADHYGSVRDAYQEVARKAREYFTPPRFDG